MRSLAWHTCGMLMVLALAGCSRDEPPARAGTLPLVPMAVFSDDERALILPDLMDLIVDPAAGVLLTAADAPARADLEARSDEAWQAVSDAAAQLLRSSDSLVDPALARGQADWLQWADAMREGASAGGAAARRHDPRGLFAAGMQMRASCQGCHARYAPQITEPLRTLSPWPQGTKS